MSIEPPIEIHDLTQDGRGVGHRQGKACFVTGALPGESVRWKLTQSHRQYDEGQLEVIVSKPSPDRAIPACRYFGSCGGCQIQHLQYPAQVEAKQQRLTKALQHKQIEVNNWLPAVTSAPWHYRRRARFALGRVSGKKSQLEIGFRRRSSNQILPIDSCPILLEELNSALSSLKDLVDALSNQQRENVVEIELSYSDARLSVSLLANKNSPATLLATPPTIFQDADIWFIPKGEKGCLIYSPQQDETLGPPGFMQANSPVNQAIVDSINALLQLNTEDVLLDLFCGSGNFSITQTERVKQVVGIEGDEVAVRRASAAAEQISNLSFRTADLFDADELKKLRPLFRKASAVILDPPRAGAEALVFELVKPKPKQILYVSCHPATFVRDAQILVEKGYRLDSIGLLDMFPQTMHAEVIAHFIL